VSVEVNLRGKPERKDQDEHDRWIYRRVCKWTGKFTYQVASKLAGTFIFGWVCRYADQQMS